MFSRVSISFILILVSGVLSASLTERSSVRCYTEQCDSLSYCDPIEHRCSLCCPSVCELQPRITECQRFCEGFQDPKKLLELAQTSDKDYALMNDRSKTFHVLGVFALGMMICMNVVLVVRWIYDSRQRKAQDRGTHFSNNLTSVNCKHKLTNKDAIGQKKNPNGNQKVTRIGKTYGDSGICGEEEANQLNARLCGPEPLKENIR